MMRTAFHRLALVAATLFSGLAAAADSTLEVNFAHNSTAGARPLAVMLDQPTGGRFAYFADAGWKFIGRDAELAEAGSALTPAAGRPASMMIDGPTGFVFTYIVDQGWKFAGRVGEAN